MSKILGTLISSHPAEAVAAAETIPTIGRPLLRLNHAVSSVSARAAALAVRRRGRGIGLLR